MVAAVDEYEAAARQTHLQDEEQQHAKARTECIPGLHRGSNDAPVVVELLDGLLLHPCPLHLDMSMQPGKGTSRSENSAAACTHVTSVVVYISLWVHM
jgi:hypothetical protein